MTTRQPQASGSLGPADLYALISSKLAEYSSNARNNIGSSLERMTLQSWIRLVIIVGGYMLFRQYVIKHSTKVAVRKMEAQEAEEKKARAQVSPNEMRGLGQQHAGDRGLEMEMEMEMDVDADERAEGTGVDWGSRARVKQRKFLREMLEKEEQRRLDEQDDDADIKEFLLD